ncbi:MAG: DUF4386 domain-containing protein [Gemmatimonadaceae bacterium]
MLEPSRRARIAGAFYVGTFVAGTLALVLRQGPVAVAANLVAGASYVAVTLLFYEIFKPVSQPISLLAAAFSLAGCVLGAVGAARGAPPLLHPFVLFGCYCLLIGYLVARSTFMPRVLGAFMAFGGLGWLTFASPALAKALFPYNLAPGILGEGLLTLWLVAKGVDARRWTERAEARAMVPRPA